MKEGGICTVTGNAQSPADPGVSDVIRGCRRFALSQRVMSIAVVVVGRVPKIGMCEAASVTSPLLH